MNKKRIFISHSWKYSNEYNKLVDLLDNRRYFDFYNHSVPIDNPLDVNNRKELSDGIKSQIRGCSVFLVIGGMYVNNSYWIKEEIKYAKRMGKPILLIIPRGQINVLKYLRENSDMEVYWNSNSIVSAIRSLS